MKNKILDEITPKAEIIIKYYLQFVDNEDVDDFKQSLWLKFYQINKKNYLFNCHYPVDTLLDLFNSKCCTDFTIIKFKKNKKMFMPVDINQIKLLHEEYEKYSYKLRYLSYFYKTAFNYYLKYKKNKLEKEKREISLNEKIINSFMSDEFSYELIFLAYLDNYEKAVVELLVEGYSINEIATKNNTTKSKINYQLQKIKKTYK